jgi:hypothetical protein
MLLPPPWDAYLRLQSTLDRSTEVNNRNWGLEAGLDAILEAAGPTPNIATSMASAERRERHRARLRRVYPSALSPAVDQPAAIEARIELEQVRQLLQASDWQLICSVGIGMNYQVLGRELAATPGSLRARVLRIRESLSLAA